MTLNSRTTAVARPPRAARRRLWILVAAAAVVVADLGLKAWAERQLAGGGWETGPVDLRLSFNRGVAFSAGADAPTAVVIAITAVVTVGLGVLAWWLAPRATRLQLVALVALIGGALSNLVDRAWDGRVTDYLYTGWWPTFNGADAAIVCGAALLLLAELRQGPSSGA